MSPVEAHPWTDPIVEEVRAVRDAIAARHGYDVETIAAAFAERSEASGRRTASPSAPAASGGADSIVPLRGDEISSCRTQQVENLLPQDPAK